MTTSTSENPPLHLVGTQAFLPALLSYIRSVANPTSLPLDQVIFQSILLCLIAGDRHLILRTPEEDVGLTVKLAVWTLSSIFNLPTHKPRLRPSSRASNRRNRSSTEHNLTGSSGSDPTQTFLRSLFLPSSIDSTSSSNSNQISQDEWSADSHNARPHSSHHQRQGSSSRSGKQKPKHPRSRSFPNSLSATAHAHGQNPNLNTSSSTSTSATANIILPGHEYLSMQATGAPFPHPESVAATSTTSSAGTSSILKPQPTYGYTSQAHPQFQPSPPSPRLPHAYTDPFPIPLRRNKSRSESHAKSSKRPKELPHALVLSGLEEASDGIQRAFASVISERRVVLDGYPEVRGDEDTKELGEEDGVWVLPEGFITVYVCPWNARERPGIHKILLDKFSMSTNVFVPQNIRNDFRVLPFSLSSSFASLATITAASAPLRQFQPNFFSHSNPGSPSPQQHALLPTHTPPVYTKALPGQGNYQHQYTYPQHPHHHHRSSTQFGGGSFTAHRPSSITPTQQPMPILPPSFIQALRDAYKQTHLAPKLELYLGDLMTAARHDTRMDGTLLTVRSVRDLQALAKASRVVGSDLTGMEIIRPRLLGLDNEDEEEREESYADEDGYTRLVGSDARFGPSITAEDENDIAAGGGVRQKSGLDVSEVDIARIFPRVISHRVRLRDGPEDEVLASALFGATFKTDWVEKEDTEDRNDVKEKIFDSVKSVLVNILSEV